MPFRTYLALSGLAIALMLVGCQSSPHTQAVSVGTDINTALELMEPYSDGGPMLAMAVRAKDSDLKQWPVDQGVLVAVYSVKTKKINALSFHLSDERAKAERKTFQYEVIRFDPSSRHLVLKTREPK